MLGVDGTNYVNLVPKRANFTLKNFRDFQIFPIKTNAFVADFDKAFKKSARNLLCCFLESNVTDEDLSGRLRNLVSLD